MKNESQPFNVSADSDSALIGENLNITKQKAANKLLEIITSSSQESIEYDDPENFGRPKYSEPVMTLLHILEENISEEIPLRGEPDALKKLAQIATKYSRH